MERGWVNVVDIAITMAKLAFVMANKEKSNFQQLIQQSRKFTSSLSMLRLDIFNAFKFFTSQVIENRESTPVANYFSFKQIHGSETLVPTEKCLVEFLNFYENTFPDEEKHGETPAIGCPAEYVTHPDHPGSLVNAMFRWLDAVFDQKLFKHTNYQQIISRPIPLSPR